MPSFPTGLQPPTFDPETVDEIVTVATQDAKTMARRLALEEGLFVGVSSGAAVSAAIEVMSLHFVFTQRKILRSTGHMKKWIANGLQSLAGGTSRRESWEIDNDLAAELW